MKIKANIWLIGWFILVYRSGASSISAILIGWFILVHRSGASSISAILIGWFILVHRSGASSISAIFRTRTSSVILKNYVEMSEGMGQSGQWLLIATEIGRRAQSFACKKMSHSPNTLTTMVHSRVFRIKIRQLPIERAPHIHHPGTPWAAL
jgi:hypothetical protein